MKCNKQYCYVKEVGEVIRENCTSQRLDLKMSVIYQNHIISLVETLDTNLSVITGSQCMMINMILAKLKIFFKCVLVLFLNMQQVNHRFITFCTILVLVGGIHAVQKSELHNKVVNTSYFQCFDFNLSVKVQYSVVLMEFAERTLSLMRMRTRQYLQKSQTL